MTFKLDPSSAAYKIAHGIFVVLSAILLFQPEAVPLLNHMLQAIPSGSLAARIVGFVLALFTNGPFLLAYLKGLASSKAAKVIPPVVILALLLSSPVRAQPADRLLGSCYATETFSQFCFGPSAAITLGQYNLTTGKFLGGVMPGAGYGITLFADKPYQTGLAAYASFRAGGGTDVPNQAIPSLVLSFANYIRIGFGCAFTEQPVGPVSRQWLINFGLGADFGGPEPVSAYRTNLKAERMKAEPQAQPVQVIQPMPNPTKPEPAQRADKK